MAKSDVFSTKFEKPDEILHESQVFVVNGEEKLQEIWEKAKKVRFTSFYVTSSNCAVNNSSNEVGSGDL